MIVAKRTSFSIYGQALTIAGRSLTSGTVIATLQDEEIDRQEQALIEKDGSFRVMGLAPGSTYRLILESPQVLRQLPQDLEVTLPDYEDNADVFGIKLFAFEKPSTVIIEGSVKFDDP